MKILPGRCAMAAVVSLLLSCKSSTTDIGSPGPSGAEPGIRVNTLLSDRGIIWGMDFLPDGELVFTEKAGKMYRFKNGTATEITGVPSVNTNGQGGLLDVKVDPDYASNGWLYSSYVGLDAQNQGILTLIRFKLSGNRMTGMETLLKTATPNTWYNHYGSRIVFDSQGYLYLSVGEGGTTSYGGANSPNMNAQNVQAEWGKVHRMTRDGKVPPDNPVLPGNTAPTTVYSYGHRNPQGLMFNTATNEVWENEHGPRGGDEINIIKPGRNYGWPLVSYGINYDGKAVSESPTKEGIEPPIHTWTPSIAPSGMAMITSDKFKAWKGHVLVGSLAFRYLARLEIRNGKVVKETKILTDIGRVRNIKQAPDGSIYVSVEGPGRILQLVAE
ncbi:PQQ-dependent sugar dehydrogenase [Sediminibacterium soli]|uniref:PQQ-dependent sugar dehydrogenase n=1 Tax=Sediminibacterium soli TaxID=2698829 RepID=UPI00137B11E2|nr:PQQ-dependent sugar dehydrogenase [Sediminibacterium soli]NCI46291.1 PQQ-dependent sugar dehydrogenase [Sediminibacterium soli]